MRALEEMEERVDKCGGASRKAGLRQGARRQQGACDLHCLLFPPLFSLSLSLLHQGSRTLRWVGHVDDACCQWLLLRLGSSQILNTGVLRGEQRARKATGEGMGDGQEVDDTRDKKGEESRNVQVCLGIPCIPRAPCRAPFYRRAGSSAHSAPCAHSAAGSSQAHPPASGRRGG